MGALGIDLIMQDVKLDGMSTVSLFGSRKGGGALMKLEQRGESGSMDNATSPIACCRTNYGDYGELRGPVTFAKKAGRILRPGVSTMCVFDESPQEFVRSHGGH